MVDQPGGGAGTTTVAGAAWTVTAGVVWCSSVQERQPFAMMSVPELNVG